MKSTNFLAASILAASPLSNTAAPANKNSNLAFPLSFGNGTNTGSNTPFLIASASLPFNPGE